MSTKRINMWASARVVQAGWVGSQCNANQTCTHRLAECDSGYCECIKDGTFYDLSYCIHTFPFPSTTPQDPENDTPPTYDDVVEVEDKLPSYQDALEMVAKEGETNGGVANPSFQPDSLPPPTFQETQPKTTPTADYTLPSTLTTTVTSQDTLTTTDNLTKLEATGMTSLPESEAMDQQHQNDYQQKHQEKDQQHQEKDQQHQEKDQQHPEKDQQHQERDQQHQERDQQHQEKDLQHEEQQPQPVILETVQPIHHPLQISLTDLQPRSTTTI
ncbi:hypothetical protein Pcinc_036581 [Petrolisthes cinctipes]|uniref:EB domain-containing protein n=1 Tax=Petrolisthes cinctipes TaxID=88211 RepID=A0AAE1BYA8_PETCI|nr:hypothetical protein Pcinc_036581 [Petrolisthes cinctipes]